MEIKKKGPTFTRELKKEPRVKNFKLQKDKFADVPKEYMEVAEGMETQFVNNLIQQMRKSIQKNKPESSSEKFYNSMLDFKRAGQIAKHNSIGLKEMILNQIYPRFKKQNIASQQAANKAYMKVQTSSKEIEHE